MYAKHDYNQRQALKSEIDFTERGVRLTTKVKDGGVLIIFDIQGPLLPESVPLSIGSTVF